jgi:hypothetical protein
MSTNDISIVVLEDFIKKVRSVSKAKQKQLNIPTEEAETLVYHLNLTLLKLVDKLQTAENKNKEDSQILVVSMDGGGFEETR